MAVVSLVISVLALVVGGASLGWNVLNFLLTGQRAALSVSKMRLLTATGGEMDPVVQIAVSSTGRVPVEVTGWSVAFPDNLHLHSVVVGMQYGKFNTVYLGDELPKMIQLGSRGCFNIPKIAIEKTVEHQHLDLNTGHIQVYFAARKPLRDNKSIAKRLNHT